MAGQLPMPCLTSMFAQREAAGEPATACSSDRTRRSTIDALSGAPVPHAILRATDEAQPLAAAVNTVADDAGAYTLSIPSAQPGDAIVVDVSSPTVQGSNPAQRLTVWLDWPAGSANRNF